MNISNYHCLPEKTESCCIKTKKTPLSHTATLFVMQPSGHSLLHSHKAPHTLLIIDGEGAVFDGEKLTPIHGDEVVTILPDEPHQIKNVGKKPLRLLSIS